MIKKIFFVATILSFAFSVNAQKASTQFKGTYSAAKNLLNEGKYGLSMQSFKGLLAKGEDNELVPYARFYLGNASYLNGDKDYSKNVFLELTVKHPKWHKIDAAYLWLSRIGFEQSGAFKGMLYAVKISSNPYLAQSNKYLTLQLSKEPFEVLQELYAEYSQTKEVALAYAFALNLEPSSAENNDQLNALIKEFNFDADLFNSVPPSVVKSHYTIGVMLPLYIDKMEASHKYLKKSLAVNIYEGAKMAAYDTDSTLFTLEVFDTKKDPSQISLCLTSGGMKNFDAILGPIYPKPLKKMQEIAKAEKINFLNPTSSNAAISDSSPYAFLARASAFALAQRAAAYMKTDSINKNLFIYYGTSKIDSISAFTYKEAMEADSFKVVSMLKIEKDNRREVYDILTASKTITDRRAVRHMTREQIDRAMKLPTMDSLLIQPDSIGHLFIASSDPTISTEAMSAIISRGDSIKIMGIGNWFESNNAGLGIMEGLGVTLAISAVDDVSTMEYKELTRRYIEKYKTQPSKYFFRGYFGMKAIALSLKKYGTFYQNGYQTLGNFNDLYDYKSSNANASIKIIKLVNNNIFEVDFESEESN